MLRWKNKMLIRIYCTHAIWMCWIARTISIQLKKWKPFFAAATAAAHITNTKSNVSRNRMCESITIISIVKKKKNKRKKKYTHTKKPLKFNMLCRSEIVLVFLHLQILFRFFIFIFLFEAFFDYSSVSWSRNK